MDAKPLPQPLPWQPPSTHVPPYTGRAVRPAESEWM